MESFIKSTIFAFILVMLEFNALATTDTVSIFVPPPVKLKESELKLVLDNWDAAIRSDDLWKKFDVMNRIAQPMTQIKGYGQGTILRYTNQEIQNRVVDLYLKEMGRYPRPFKETDREKEKKTNPWYGMDEGYMELLCALAETTFSEKIYHYEFNPIDFGILLLRPVYFAKTKPEITLQQIVTGTIGMQHGKKKHYIFLSTINDNGIFDIWETFQILSLMCDYSPDVVTRHKAEILRFAREYAMYLAVPHEVYSKPAPEYNFTWDLRLRNLALNLFEKIGEPQDLALIEKMRPNPSKKDRELLDKLKGVKTFSPTLEEVNTKIERVKAKITNR